MGRNEIDKLWRKYDELHDLLCDYDQEERYIELIHKTMQEIIDKLPKGSKIGFRPCGAPTEWLIKNFAFTNVNITGIFDKNVEFGEICSVPVYEADGNEVEGVDILIVTSFNWHDEILAELGKTHCEVLDIYRELEKYEVDLCASPETYIKGTHTILHDYLMRWKQADESDKEEALRNLLTVACEEKDFYMINDLCEKHKVEYSFCRVCQQKYNELYELMRSLVEKREQKDILWYWVDAVPYSWGKLFKGLWELSKEGLCFKQAYTATPFTTQTHKACFSGVLPLDDCEKSLERLEKENSDLIQYLSSNDYAICEIAEASFTWENEINKEFLFDMPQTNVSCNAILWHMLCKLIETDKQAFLVAHLLTETHPPVICAEQKEMKNIYLYDDRESRFLVSANYVDKRVVYYSKLLGGGRRIQIIMSDHGDPITKRTMGKWWVQQKLHTFCFALGKDIVPRQEERIFSYIKFKEFVKWLIEPEKYDYEGCFTDHAVFQDTDIYTENLINRYIRLGKAEKALAYRGALDGKFKYFINSIGRESFFRIVGDEDIEIDKETNPEVFSRLKEWAGTDFPDLTIYEKYKYISRLYDAVNTQL